MFPMPKPKNKTQYKSKKTVPNPIKSHVQYIRENEWNTATFFIKQTLISKIKNIKLR